MLINPKVCALWALLLLATLSARAQWVPVDSGTTSNLYGVFLLESGVGYAVGDGGTILKTTDVGVNWNALTSGTTKALYDTYFFNDTEGVAVGDSGLILRTIDGSTWQTVASGVRDSLRAISFNGAHGICGGLNQDIIYSSDSGATWRVSQKNFFGGGFFGTHMISPTVGFITGQNSIFQPMQGTTVDGGVHWSFHPFYFDSNEGGCDDVFFFDETNGVTSGVVWDGTGAIATTSNGGSDWTTSLFPSGMQGMDFPKPNSGFAVGFAGTIMKSNDSGNTWSPQTSGTLFDLFDVHFTSAGQTGLVTGAAGTILRTTNGGQAGGMELLSAVSSKGSFDIDLPLTKPFGVESRSGGAGGNYSLTLTFNNPISSVDDIATSCGSVKGSRIADDDVHRLLVNLTGVNCNEQYLTVTLTNVHDDQGNTLSSAAVTAGLLLGDINGDGVVDNTDSHETKIDRGQPNDASNFREDINTNGHIDKTDFNRVKAQIGTALPP